MLDKLFNGQFMPHGYCFQWQNDVLYFMLIGDFLTVISYGLIPVALIYLVKKRDDLNFNSVFYLFAGFIAFCGITHLINILNIWNGYYYLSSIAKLATGFVSILTTFTLWRLMPTFLAIPSNAELIDKNEKLLNAQEKIVLANQDLEEKVKVRTAALEQLANTDQLTKVKNRRAILKNLDEELKRQQRHPKALSLLMLDLDYFKKINDTYGHVEGDFVLAEAAKTINKTCRETDAVGRYGGEEFLILLPETAKQDAIELAERIRVAIADNPTTNKYQLTCSIGVSAYQPDITALELIKKADDRTYEAKKNGRNQVVFES